MGRSALDCVLLDLKRSYVSGVLVELGFDLLPLPFGNAQRDLFAIPEELMRFCAIDNFGNDSKRADCAGSAGTGERGLRVSVDAALRAGIFKASGSIDPMGFWDERERSVPRP